LAAISSELQSNSDDKKQSKEFLEKFEILWNSGTISDEEKKMIYQTSNAILSKRAMIYPHINNYIQSIYFFFNTGHDKGSYNSWDKAINFIIGNKKMTLRNVETFLQMTVDLFKTNSIYKSSTTEWRADNNDFKFQWNQTIRLIYGEMNLICYAKRDSIVIYKTKGVYYPLEDNKWIGTNGKVTWERAGFKPEEVYAMLNNYTIKMSQSKYETDTVSFVNTAFFDKPLLGSFEEKATEIISEEKATYPRFESFTKRFQIKNIYDGVDYDGGFSMHGAKFLGSGSKEEPAQLFFYRDNKIFLKTSAKLYTFRPDRIIATNAFISFRIAEDSIFHPGLLFKYFVDKRTIELIRDGEGLSNSPFFNSYHKIDMDFENLTWKIDDPKMDFRMLKGSTFVRAVFESSNFFSKYRFEKLQGMDETNPLVWVNKFIKQYGFDEFSLNELANFMRKDIAQVRNLMLTLAFQGIIDYDFYENRIKVKQRFYDYLNSFAGKIDYDVISFFSEPEGGGDNASLNLLNNELKIRGVDQIQLSDSQNVVIFPEGEEILLKKNRDFEFAGKIRAGLFVFFWQEIFF
jgi:hypothetical protein